MKSSLDGESLERRHAARFFGNTATEIFKCRKSLDVAPVIAGQGHEDPRSPVGWDLHRVPPRVYEFNTNPCLADFEHFAAQPLAAAFDVEAHLDDVAELRDHASTIPSGCSTGKTDVSLMPVFTPTIDSKTKMQMSATINVTTQPNPPGTFGCT